MHSFLDFNDFKEGDPIITLEKQRSGFVAILTRTTTGRRFCVEVICSK